MLSGLCLLGVLVLNLLLVLIIALQDLLMNGLAAVIGMALVDIGLSLLVLVLELLWML